MVEIKLYVLEIIIVIRLLIYDFDCFFFRGIEYSNMIKLLIYVSN